MNSYNKEALLITPDKSDAGVDQLVVGTSDFGLHPSPQTTLESREMNLRLAKVLDDSGFGAVK